MFWLQQSPMMVACAYEKLMQSLKKCLFQIIDFQGTFGGRPHPKAQNLREKQSSLSHFPPSKIDSKIEGQRILEGCLSCNNW